MFACNCGREYQREKSFIAHQEQCVYKDLDLKTVYWIGSIIDDANSNIFRVSIGPVKKYAKENNLEYNTAKEILQKELIYKYRRSLWEINLVWTEELLISEYREFAKWVFATYKDISLISLKSMLANTKVIYRFNFEHTAQIIGRRIDDSLTYVNEHDEFVNDFEFVAAVTSGDISMYYVLFNDWLAEKWFGRLDRDLQKELECLYKIASKTILERLTADEFDLLQKLAGTSTPVIFEM